MVSKVRKSVWWILVFALTYVLVGALLDRVIFPEAEPGAQYYPPAGHVFISESEGFRQKLLKREGGLAWLELVLEPHAPGPPEHIHTSFAENFIVAEGTLSLLVDGEKKVLHPGESFLVRPGTSHKPFNETDARVVIRGPLTPEYALPERFTVFLTQAYRFFDESESNGRPPKALLQMSRFSPEYDSWLSGAPIPLQRAVYFIIGPTARFCGYRAYYERYAPRA